jgi:hypothetical protein
MYRDRVKDTTTSTGTGAITFAGVAPTGYQTFQAGFGSAQTVAYCIADQTGANWEVGTGNFNGTTGLTRTTVLGSSNANALVNFAAGTKDVFCTAPASYLLPFTSTTQGVVPASAGGTTNYLRADGTFAVPPGTVTTPAGSTTQVQYNNAGAFAGNANFTYDSGTNTLTIGNITGSALGMTIQPKAPTSLETGGKLILLTPNAVKANTNTGAIEITTGNQTGTGSAGSIKLNVGGLGFNIGGNVSIQKDIVFNAGSTPSSGGNFTLTAGTALAASGAAGSMLLIGGNATGNNGIGGGFTLQSGDAGIGGSGGIVSFTSGSAPTSGVPGDILFNLGYDGANVNFASAFFYTSAGTALQISANATESTFAFFGGIPVVQQKTGGASATRAAVIGTVANVGDTYDGYTLAQVVKALRNYGLLT